MPRSYTTDDKELLKKRDPAIDCFSIDADTRPEIGHVQQLPGAQRCMVHEKSHLLGLMKGAMSVTSRSARDCA